MEECDESGVTAALEKIRVLESRLRHAIQNSHTLSTSFGSDAVTADRERDALLSVGEMLELLEDKLREYRLLTLNPREYDDRTVTLSQLDSLRRELIDTARTNLAFVIFGKDVVKDVLAFAEVADSGTPREGPLSPIQPPPLGQTLSPTGHSPMSGKAAWEEEPSRVRRELKLQTSELDEGFVLRTPPSAAHPALRASWPGVDSTAAEADRIIQSAYRACSGNGTGQLARSAMLSPRVVLDSELYRQTNGGSRYTFDPEYGGKIDVAGRRARDAATDGAAPAAASEPTRPPADRPRVRELFGSEAAARPPADARSEDDSASTCAWHPRAPARRYTDAAPPPPTAASRRRTVPRHTPSPERSHGSQGALEAARRGVAALAVGALATVAAVGAMEVVGRLGHVGERRRGDAQRRARAAAALEGGGGARALPSGHPSPSPKAQRYAAPAAAEPPASALFPQQPPPVIASARA
ncbi:hypothetical protein WJX81_001670 [Elliptochloris bilobata]|uniref:Uncharacterized protein n=1 Tax=Elliptochloris bilobata TaxID=381761 RepID=A0AAW1RKM3_9CHLO